MYFHFACKNNDNIYALGDTVEVRLAPEGVGVGEIESLFEKDKKKFAIISWY